MIDLIFGFWAPLLIGIAVVAVILGLVYVLVDLFVLLRSFFR